MHHGIIISYKIGMNILSQIIIWMEEQKRQNIYWDRHDIYIRMIAWKGKG